MTVSLTKFFDALNEGKNSVSNEVEWQLCTSCFLISISLTLMRMLHKGILYHLAKRSRLVHTAFRALMASLHLFVYLSPHGELIAGRVLTHALIAFTLNTIDVLVNIRSTERKMVIQTNAAEVQYIESGEKNSSDRFVSPVVSADEEYYVDFNDRNSLICRLPAKDKNCDDAFFSSCSDDTNVLRQSDNSLTVSSPAAGEARRKSIQLNRSSTPGVGLKEALLYPNSQTGVDLSSRVDDEI